MLSQQDIPMSRAGRKRKLVQRENNGRATRAVREASKPLDPIIAYRAKESAALGLRSPEWGSPCGQWFMAGKLSPSQYDAAKRYAGLVVTVRALMGIPVPKTALSIYGLPGGPSSDNPDPSLVLAYRDQLEQADRVISTAARGGKAVLIRATVDGEHDAPNFPVLEHCLSVLARLWGVRKS